MASLNFASFFIEFPLLSRPLVLTEELSPILFFFSCYILAASERQISARTATAMPMTSPTLNLSSAWVSSLCRQATRCVVFFS